MNLMPKPRYERRMEKDDQRSRVVTTQEPVILFPFRGGRPINHKLCVKV